MKRTKLIFSVLMAIAMMAMCPTNAWAQRYLDGEITEDINDEYIDVVSGRTLTINAGVTIKGKIYLRNFGTKLINYGNINEGVQNSGDGTGTIENYGTINGTVANDNGTLKNFGTINATVTNNGGTVENHGVILEFLDIFPASSNITNDGEWTITDYSNFKYIYSRDIKASWNTICIPFEATSTDDMKFYTIQSLTDGLITLQYAKTLAPGNPALVYTTSNTELEIVSKIGAFKDAPVSASGTNCLVGTFMGTTVPGATDTEHYYFGLSANTGKYVKVSSDVELKPFRAYIKCEKPAVGSGAATLRQVIADEDINETAISDVIDTLNDSEAQYFDMNGRKIAELKKGINIISINGKKVKVLMK